MKIRLIFIFNNGVWGFWLLATFCRTKFIDNYAPKSYLLGEWIEYATTAHSALKDINIICLRKIVLNSIPERTIQS